MRAELHKKEPIVKSTPRFNDVLPLFRQALEEGPPLPAQARVVVIRDMFGRGRLAIDPLPDGGLEDFAQALHSALGPYSPGAENLVLGPEDLLDPEEVFASPNLLQPWLEHPTWSLLERTITGADWMRRPLETAPRIPRVIFYGIKGGVGRSTACVLLARHLADQGRRVLVVDLDLESPGTSASLLPGLGSTRYGVVDWLLEEAVGGLDDDLVRGMAKASPLDLTGPGEVLVAPAAGANEQDYLSKLSRIYVDVTPAHGAEGFAGRLARMVADLERVHKPDVVLLDSRAGLHDLAAVALTRLGGLGLLFAGNGRQTWNAYRTLLQSWKMHPSRDQLRGNLCMVASMVPELGGRDYMDRFLDASYDLWASTLYEEQGPEDSESFNFDRDSLEAPHYPLPINWSRTFLEFDPLQGAWEESRVLEAFREFLDAVTTRLQLGDRP